MHASDMHAHAVAAPYQTSVLEHSAPPLRIRPTANANFALGASRQVYEAPLFSPCS